MAAKDTPGVIAPPPLIFLGFLLLAFLLDFVWPWPIHPSAKASWAWWIAGGVAVAAGLVLIISGIRNFTRAGTAVPTRAPTRVLVTTGVHGLMRNPLYLSMFVMYLGIAVVANLVWALILVGPLALIIRYGVVAREEVYLERKFGDDYRAYKARVRRWL